MSKQLNAVPVERDEDGYWTHPDFPDMPESISLEAAQQLFEPLGVAIGYDCMLDVLPEDHQAVKNYDASGRDIRAWEPTIPADCFLLSVHDTEDGPVAIYAKPLAIAA